VYFIITTIDKCNSLQVDNQIADISCYAIWQCTVVPAASIY